MIDQHRYCRADPGKAVPQQVFCQRQNRPGLRRKQIDHGTGDIGKQQLRRIPDVAVVGRKLPCGLPTDQKDHVDDGIQEPSPVLGALCQNQGIQGCQPFEDPVLIIAPVPCPAEFHKIRGIDRRKRVTDPFLPLFHQKVSVISRYLLPGLPAYGRRQGRKQTADLCTLPNLSKHLPLLLSCQTGRNADTFLPALPSFRQNRHTFPSPDPNLRGW